MPKTTIYFDMDGTIANFYGVEGWLSCLEKSYTKPYREAAPMIDPKKLGELLRAVKAKGYKIGIISWGSRTCTPEFFERIAAAKMRWLAKYFPFAEEIHIVPYGTPKKSVVADKNGWLIDDEERNLQEWGERAIPATSMMTFLEGLK